MQHTGGCIPFTVVIPASLNILDKLLGCVLHRSDKKPSFMPLDANKGIYVAVFWSVNAQKPGEWWDMLLCVNPGWIPFKQFLLAKDK